MPFGLASCEAVFSRFMNQFFSRYDKFAIIYLDVLFMAFENAEACVQHVRKML